MTRVGIFELVDPPTGAADIIAKTLAAIDYPWDRLKPWMVRNGLNAIEIRFSEENAGAATAYFSTGGWIVVSQQFTNWRDSLPFVLTHEIGHMVDAATFDTATRAALIEVLHSGPGMSGMLAHSHDSTAYKHPDEEWADAAHNDYVARLNEAFADHFVVAFAPDTWAASHRGPRFVHWTDDLAAVRRIVLEAGATQPKPKPRPKPTPVPTPPPVARTRPRKRRRWWPCRWWGWFGK